MSAGQSVSERLMKALFILVHLSPRLMKYLVLALLRARHQEKKPSGKQTLNSFPLFQVPMRLGLPDTLDGIWFLTMTTMARYRTTTSPIYTRECRAMNK